MNPLLPYYLRVFRVLPEEDDAPDHEEDLELAAPIGEPLTEFMAIERSRKRVAALRRSGREVHRWEVCRRAEVAFDDVTGYWAWVAEVVHESRQEVVWEWLRVGTLLQEVQHDGSWVDVTIVHKSPGGTHIHAASPGDPHAMDYTAGAARKKLRRL